MKRRISIWSILIICSVAGTGLLAAGTAFLIRKYPWPNVASDFENASVSGFVNPWPQSPLEEELAERKRLKKKVKKSEVNRRFEIQLRHMESLNIPIHDLFTDPTAQLLSNQTGERALRFAAFPWPRLDTKREFGDYAIRREKVSYFVLPSNHGASLAEGVVLLSGEELRVAFPLVKKARRVLTFKVFPLTSGTLKIYVGQHLWLKNFAEDEVNKQQTVSVFINDSTAAQMRVIAVTANAFFLNAKVNQVEHSGRLPIQVGEGRTLWQPNPKYLNEEEKDQEVEEEEITPVESSEVVAESTATPEPEPSVKPPVQPDARDPLDERANKQILSSQAQTVALGYNTLFLQLNEIDQEILVDRALMTQVAPHITTLLDDSVSLSQKALLPADPIRLFRETILTSDIPPLKFRTETLTQEILASNSGFNLYSLMRNYGYQVAGFAVAEAYGFNKQLAFTSDVGSFGDKWLETNDWRFVEKKRQIDEESAPVRGLEAIFPSQKSAVGAPLSETDYQNLNRYLSRVAESTNNVPDWQANELYFPDQRRFLYARLLNSFQNWTKENTQVRFLAHLLLNANEENTSPSFKDLIHVAKTQRTELLSHSARTNQLVQLAHLDKAVEQILDTLIVRKIENRTLIATIIPFKKNAGKNFTHGILALKLPGLVPAVSDSTGEVRLDDLVATTLSTVGIPVGHNVVGAVVAHPGFALEQNVKPAELSNLRKMQKNLLSSRRKRVTLFSMAVHPQKKGCAPFTWQADQRIFGVESTHPVFEIPPRSKTLTFYPCALPDVPIIRLAWFQDDDSTPSIGGSFVFPEAKGSKADSATFLFGKSHARLGSPIFSLSNPQTLEGLARLFLGEEPSEGTAADPLIKEALTFANGMPNDGESERTVVHLWKTKVISD